MTFYLFLCHCQYLRFFRLGGIPRIYSSSTAYRLLFLISSDTRIMRGARWWQWWHRPSCDHWPQARGRHWTLSKLGKSRHGNMDQALAASACVTVTSCQAITSSRVTRMGLKPSMVMPRDNISIIETLGPLSVSRMRLSPSRTHRISQYWDD